MKRFLPLFACLLPLTASSEEVDWNHYESSGIPPHGKYSEWIGFYSEDGKNRAGFLWSGNQVSFGNVSLEDSYQFNLLSRRDFGAYSVIEKHTENKENRFASVKVNESPLSLVFEMDTSRRLQAYLSSESSCKPNLKMLIDNSIWVADVCDIDSKLIKNAKELQLTFNDRSYSVSTTGSGASMIWLRDIKH
jgi:hypothetical protein